MAAKAATWTRKRAATVPIVCHLNRRMTTKACVMHGERRLKGVTITLKEMHQINIAKKNSTDIPMDDHFPPGHSPKA